MTIAKLTAFIKQTKISEYYYTIYYMSQIYNLTTTVPCKVKLYWDSSRVSGLNIIFPN